MTQWVNKPPEPVIPEAEITGPGVPTTALYRFYDADDRLLYVGVSDNLAARFKFHRQTQWWSAVARKTIAWYGTRNKAFAAEDWAIKTECPLHNLQGQSAPGDLRYTGHRPIRWAEGEQEFFTDVAQRLLDG